MSKVQHLFKSKSSGGGRRKYGKLSLRQRIEIIKASEQGFSQRALAREYNCGKTQIHLLVTQKGMWLDKWERSKQGKNTSRTRQSPDQPVQQDPYASINNIVLDFCSKLSTMEISISGRMLQERATQIAKGLNHSDFSADNDWLETFCASYDIALNDDDDDSELKLLKCVESWTKDSALVQTYDICDIYNLGEVRLAYKFVPNDSSSMKPLSTRDYLTVSLCCSASGAKEAEVVVYDSSQHGDVCTDVYSQSVSNWKGIMTQSLYEKRLLQLNADMARQNRHILLLVDESKYSGSLECTMSNVKVKSTAACLQSQPLLCGIGHMFKFLYCRRLLRTLTAHLTVEGNVDELVEKITLGKAVRLIQNAWDDVQPRTILNSFIDAGLKHFKGDIDDTYYFAESDEALLLEIKHLISLVHKQNISEDLSDDYFTSLLSEEPCSNSTSDCSDIELDDPCVESTGGKNLKATKGSEKYSLSLDNQLNTGNLISTDLETVINDTLPCISKLGDIASVLCSKDQLQRARVLLSDLEDLFENVITDHKSKNGLQVAE